MMPKRISDGSIQRQRSAEITEEMRRLRQTVSTLESELGAVRQRAGDYERRVRALDDGMLGQAAELVTLKGEVAAIKTKVEAPKL